MVETGAARLDHISPVFCRFDIAQVQAEVIADDDKTGFRDQYAQARARGTANDSAHGQRVADSQDGVAGNAWIASEVESTAKPAPPVTLWSLNASRGYADLT